jgi:Cu(I)/Ag(I) efflux system membrane protein CusA/SilA
MLVVSIVIFVFLLHARSALIRSSRSRSASRSPSCRCSTRASNANIMSLGGIAVAIGAMVDAAIIVVENVHKRSKRGSRRAVPATRRRDPARDAGGRAEHLLRAARDHGVVPADLRARGNRGRLFKPLAFTKTYAMGFAARALGDAHAGARGAADPRADPRRARQPDQSLARVGYAPVVRFVGAPATLRGRRSAAPARTAVPAFLSLGSEFMPPLNEGTLLYMPTAPPGIAIGEASRILQLMDRELREVPEVERVFGKIGRAETPTDPAPLSMVETIVQLAPRESGGPGSPGTRSSRSSTRSSLPGMPNLWWMPIQTRTEMLATGVRSQLGVKVFGDDLAQVEQAAIAIAEALQSVPGTRNAFAERATGAFYLDARTDRARAARYGVSVEDVNTTLEAAIGRTTVSQTVAARALCDPGPLRARLPVRPGGRGPNARADVAVALVPLRELADLSFTHGPDMVRSEAGQARRPRGGRRRRAADRRLRERGAAVVAERVTLPPGPASRGSGSSSTSSARRPAPDRAADHARAGRAAALPEHALRGRDRDGACSRCRSR